MAKLYLVRHGQTDWNAEKRFQGSMDIPLNETGRKQAKEAAVILSEISFAAVYASPLKRAHETAEILKGDRPHPIYIEQDLREGSFGSLEGQIYSGYSLWEDYRQLTHEQRLHHKMVDDQETMHEVITRAYPCLKKIALKHPGKDVLIVTHAGVMKNLLTHIEGSDWSTTKILNTQILVLEWTLQQTFTLHSSSCKQTHL